LYFTDRYESFRGALEPMMKPLLLKIHRWIGVLFALPLLTIASTGLILACEPVVQVESVRSQSIDASSIVNLLKRYDPDNKARGLVIDAAAHRLTLQRGTSLSDIDLVTGQAQPNRLPLANLFQWARATHKQLLGMPQLVTASTIAMAVMVILGIAMGLPRLRNNLAGWHKAAAWFTLPAIVLAPLTALCMLAGFTMQKGAAPNIGLPASLADAVLVVAKSHDLGQVIQIGQRGGRMMTRLYEGNELRSYAIGESETAALPRNVPRLIHEGNWSALISGPANALASLVLLGLIVTGSLAWARRWLRRRRRTTSLPAVPAVQGLQA
jgi:uncharacterized iron-regulated membrane protein